MRVPGLPTSALPLREIAAALGYADQFHRSKTFKRLTGTSPRAFRAQHGDAQHEKGT